MTMFGNTSVSPHEGWWQGRLGWGEGEGHEAPQRHEGQWCSSTFLKPLVLSWSPAVKMQNCHSEQTPPGPQTRCFVKTPGTFRTPFCPALFWAKEGHLQGSPSRQAVFSARLPLISVLLKYGQYFNTAYLIT